MAPLTHADLTHPQGWVVRTQHFPLEDLGAFQVTLDTYLAEAYADTRVVALPDAAAKNIAAKLWAYYRVCDAIVKRMTSIEWTSSKQGEGSKAQAAEQLAEWQRERAKYAALVAGVLDAVVAPLGGLQPTVMLPTDVVWN